MVDWSLLDPNMAAKVGGSFQQGQMNQLALQDRQQEQQMNAMKMQQAQQEMANQNALKQAFQESGGDLQKAKTALMAGGHYEAGMKIGEHLAKQDKLAIETKKAKTEAALKNIEYIDHSLGGVNDQASLDAARQHIAENSGPEYLARIPATYDPQAIDQVRMQAVPIKSQLEMKLKHEYNVAVSGQGQQRLGIEERRVGLAESEAHRKASEPPKLENIPPAHRAAYMENEAALNKIDAAIEMIKANPGALGIGNVAGEFVTQRTDPEGVATRAAIAEIGSQKRHELSGASVTASESPILAPFIPKTTDEAEAAIKKAMSLKKHYLEANKQFEEEYSKPDYKNPLPTKAKERSEKIDLIDELQALKKEGKITFGAKGGKEMDLEKQPIEDLRKLRDSIKGEKSGSIPQETKIIRGKTYYKINGEWHE